MNILESIVIVVLALAVAFLWSNVLIYNMYGRDMGYSYWEVVQINAAFLGIGNKRFK